MNCLKIINKAWDRDPKRTLNSVWRKLWSNCVLRHDFEGVAHERDQPVINEFVSLGRESFELEVNEDDIQEVVDERGQELTTDELINMHHEQQQE